MFFSKSYEKGDQFSSMMPFPLGASEALLSRERRAGDNMDTSEQEDIDPHAAS